MNRSSAIALVIFTGILWSTGGFIIKLISWPPLAIAGIRSGIAFIVVSSYDKPKKIPRDRYTIIGAICFSIMVICFVLGNKLTTAGNTILIQYTAPIYVAIFGFAFLKEKSRLIDWITIGVVFIGLSLFFLDDLSIKGFWGNIAAIFSGFGFAGLTLCLRKQKNSRPIDSILLGNLITFVLCFPFIVQQTTSNFQEWYYIIFLGVIQQGLSYIVFSIAIKNIRALDAVIYTVFEPLFNPFFAYLFLGETMGVFAIVGGFIIFLCVTIRGYYQIKEPL